MRRIVSDVVVVIALLAAVSGCRILGSDDASAPSGGSGVEKSKIRVSIQPLTDLGPFWLAQDAGYFKAEGLDVETVMAASGQASTANVVSGAVDIAFSSYVSLFTAKGSADLLLVSDATSVSPNSNAIVVGPNSPAKTLSGLAGRKVAITAKNTASDVLTKSVMSDHRVPYDSVIWVELPFPQVAAALRQGRVDAAYVAEPYVTIAADEADAIPVIDIGSGATQDFPLAGYGATKKWVHDNPRTLAAFQRAMKKATLDAAGDRSKVEPLLVKHAKINETVAKLLSMPAFGSTLDARRIQRVPDLLLRMGVITAPVDAARRIAPQQDPR
ncbi:ABC transporter substrate-binding protein [Amycolatopsis sp. NPDC003865]